MKKFLIYFVSLLMATVVLLFINDRLNIHLIFSSSNSNPYKMYRLFIDHPKGEIPIIGSSRAEAGFAPKDLSPLAFNYGLSGSSFRETAFHLKEILSRDDCKLVIVNLDPWGLRNGIFRGNYRFAAASPLVKAEPKIHIALMDKIPGIRFQGEMRGNVAQCMNNRLAATKTMEAGAILQRLSRNDEEWQYIISKIESPGFGVDDETRTMIEEVLKNNINKEIVFVVSPIAQPWWNAFSGKDKLRSFEKWLKTFEHVTVLDHDDISAGYELNEFMDLTHLNESGARRFTQTLRTRLEKIGLL